MVDYFKDVEKDNLAPDPQFIHTLTNKLIGIGETHMTWKKFALAFPNAVLRRFALWEKWKNLGDIDL